MPAIIDSAPDCIISESGTEEARVEDSADFVIGNNWQDCAGFMTFGPGSTYGPEGSRCRDHLHGAHLGRDRRSWSFTLVAWIAVREPPLDHLRSAGAARRAVGRRRQRPRPKNRI